jgi:sulfide:quinone oxidoreductase
MKRVVVLGAGFGGLELASRISDEFGGEFEGDVEVVLIDRADGFVFGFAKLDVLFGRKSADEVRHRYRDLARPGVRFVRAEVVSIDAEARRVVTDAGPFDGDALVVALGAELHPEQTPGLVEAGEEFYTLEGAVAARAALDRFEGGRVLIGVTSTPYKCAPAPSEAAFLLHDELVARGLRDRSEITLVVPMPKPVPPSPPASAAILERFQSLGIGFRPERIIQGLDPERRVAVLSDGEELPFDLFLGVPRHRAPRVVVDAGLTVDGWIPADPATLETTFPGVYALGDIANTGAPKAGAFAEGQAAIAAARIAARLRGEDPTAEYSGTGACFLEFGAGEVARVEGAFTPGQPPQGGLSGPTAEIAAGKVEFSVSRISRWFGA